MLRVPLTYSFYRTWPTFDPSREKKPNLCHCVSIPLVYFLWGEIGDMVRVRSSVSFVSRPRLLSDQEGRRRLLTENARPASFHIATPERLARQALSMILWSLPSVCRWHRLLFHGMAVFSISNQAALIWIGQGSCQGRGWRLCWRTGNQREA